MATAPAVGGRWAAFRRRAPAYATVNPLSTGFLFFLPATLGSGVAIWFHGCLIWCVFEVASRRRSFSRDRPMWIVAGFLALFCAANLAGFLLNGVPEARADRLVPLLTLLGLPFLYSILTISRKSEIAFAAVAGSAVAAYVAAVVAVVQHYFWDIRAEGLAGNALVFAHAVTLAGSMCLLGLLQGFGNWRGLRLQGLLAGGFAAALVALVLSGSRSYWAAMLACTLCIGLFCRGTAALPGRRALLLGVAGALMLGAFAFKPVTARMATLDRIYHNVTVKGRYNNSLGQRLLVWGLGAQLVRAHPLIGYGTPSSRHMIHTAFEGNPGPVSDFSHFHSGFLTAAVEAGALGLAALVGALATLAATAARALRKRGADPAQRLGGGMLMVLVLTSVLAGSVNILIGHDILDATFVTWIMVGLFLASGTPALPQGPHEAERLAAR